MPAIVDSPFTRIGGSSDDPLLRADIIKKELALQALADEAEAVKSSECQAEDSSAGRGEDSEDPKNELGAGVDPPPSHNLLRRKEEESRECALTKHVRFDVHGLECHG